MGADIHGWIEAWDKYIPAWQGLMSFEFLVNRNYDIFGCLFGVRNYACFMPVAANRGLPTDISSPIQIDFWSLGDDAHSATWIGWPEIKACLAGEPVGEEGYALLEYNRNAQSRWVATGKTLAGIPFPQTSTAEGGGSEPSKNTITYELQERNEQGQWVFQSARVTQLSLTEWVGLDELLAQLEPGTRDMAWEVGDTLYKLAPVSRKEVLHQDKDWMLLFRIMEVLESRYDPDNLRLVVWFDN